MKKKPNLDDLDVVFDPTPLTAEEKKTVKRTSARTKPSGEKNNFIYGN